MTALQTIPKAVVSGTIRLARLPADTVLRVAPESVATSARLAVDSADAAARNVAGNALRDSDLRGEAERLRQAVAERRRALGLRERATERIAEADEQATKARADAEQRRQKADQDAERKRRQARKRREKKKTEAENAEKQRKQMARKRAAKKQEKVEERAKDERVDALQVKAGALREREQALTATDEAQRLKDAAARAKEERKRQTAKTGGSDSNGRS